MKIFCKKWLIWTGFLFLWMLFTLLLMAPWIESLQPDAPNIGGTLQVHFTFMLFGSLALALLLAILDRAENRVALFRLEGCECALVAFVLVGLVNLLTLGRHHFVGPVVRDDFEANVCALGTTVFISLFCATLAGICGAYRGERLI